MHYNSTVFIGKREISLTKPAYFIADIASNHDGDLERAKKLIYLAKASGADAVKFQHFKAETIVSDFGFKSLKEKISHQTSNILSTTGMLYCLLQNVHDVLLFK